MVLADIEGFLQESCKSMYVMWSHIHVFLMPIPLWGNHERAMSLEHTTLSHRLSAGRSSIKIRQWNPALSQNGFGQLYTWHHIAVTSVVKCRRMTTICLTHIFNVVHWLKLSGGNAKETRLRIWYYAQGSA